MKIGQQANHRWNCAADWNKRCACVCACERVYVKRWEPGVHDSKKKKLETNLTTTLTMNRKLTWKAFARFDVPKPARPQQKQLIFEQRINKTLNQSIANTKADRHWRSIDEERTHPSQRPPTLFKQSNSILPRAQTVSFDTDCTTIIYADVFKRTQTQGCIHLHCHQSHQDC